MFKGWQAANADVKLALKRRLRHADDVDDVLQEAFVRLAAYQRHTPVQNPAAFLMRTALNLVVDVFRARRVRGRQVPLEDELLADTAQASPEDMAAARERLAQLDAALRALGDTTHDIYFHVRFRGMRYAEAARRYKMTVSGVEKHMAKATLLVAQTIEGWKDES